MHAINKKKKKRSKKVYRFLRARCKQKNKDSINQSPQLLISSDSYFLHEIYFVRLISHLNLQHRFFFVFLFFNL